MFPTIEEWLLILATSLNFLLYALASCWTAPISDSAVGVSKETLPEGRLQAVTQFWRLKQFSGVYVECFVQFNVSAWAC